MGKDKGILFTHITMTIALRQSQTSSVGSHTRIRIYIHRHPLFAMRLIVTLRPTACVQILSSKFLLPLPRRLIRFRAQISVYVGNSFKSRPGFEAPYTWCRTDLFAKLSRDAVGEIMIMQGYLDTIRKTFTVRTLRCKLGGNYCQLSSPVDLGLCTSHPHSTPHIEHIVISLPSRVAY